jgi:hypothetical protein
LDAVVFGEEEGEGFLPLSGITFVGEEETGDGMGAERVHERSLLLSEDTENVVGKIGVGIGGPLLVIVSGVVENSEVLSASG